MITDMSETVKTEADPMDLEPAPYMVVGYRSEQIGLIWYTPDEWYRPFVLCRNSIVDTETGPAVVTSVNGEIQLEPIWTARGMQQEAQS